MTSFLTWIPMPHRSRYKLNQHRIGKTSFPYRGLIRVPPFYIIFWRLLCIHQEVMLYTGFTKCCQIDYSTGLTHQELVCYIGQLSLTTADGTILVLEWVGGGGRERGTFPQCHNMESCYSHFCAVRHSRRRYIIFWIIVNEDNLPFLLYSKQLLREVDCIALSNSTYSVVIATWTFDTLHCLKWLCV